MNINDLEDLLSPAPVTPQLQLSSLTQGDFFKFIGSWNDNKVYCLEGFIRVRDRSPPYVARISRHEQGCKLN